MKAMKKQMKKAKAAARSKAAPPEPVAHDEEDSQQLSEAPDEQHLPDNREDLLKVAVCNYLTDLADLEVPKDSLARNFLEEAGFNTQQALLLLTRGDLASAMGSLSAKEKIHVILIAFTFLQRNFFHRFQCCSKLQ